MPASLPILASRRRAAARVFAVGIGLLGSSLLLARGSVRAIEAIDPDPWGVGRTRAILDELPRIAASPGNTVLVIGASEVMMGFSPELFDAELAKRGKTVTSYNLGIPGMSPDILLPLTRRLNEAYRRSATRPALIVVVPSALMMTKVYSKQSLQPWGEQLRMPTVTPAMVLHTARRDPGRALALFDHYLLGGVLPDSMTGWWQARWDTDRWCGMALRGPWTPEQIRATEEWCRQLNGVYHGAVPVWDAALRGQPKMSFPETRDNYRLFIRAANMPEHLIPDRQRRVRCCDALELHFDPESVDQFVVAIRQLRGASPRVSVVLMPTNDKWLPRSPAALERLHETVSRIETEGGIPVIDLSKGGGITEEDFMDTTHLNELGGVQKFSAQLAETVADRLP